MQDMSVTWPPSVALTGSAAALHNSASYTCEALACLLHWLLSCTAGQRALFWHCSRPLRQPDRCGLLIRVRQNCVTMCRHAQPKVSAVLMLCINAANATFSIDGKRHKLVANDVPHALHGGGPKLGWGAQVSCAFREVPT